MTEVQPDLYGGPAIAAEFTPPLREVVPVEPPTPIRAMLLRACAATGLSLRELVGPSKLHAISRVRMAVYVAAWRPDDERFSSVIVAKHMNRDGSTIRKQHKAGLCHLERDPEFAALVDKIRGAA